jgi:hypothetical protein
MEAKISEQATLIWTDREFEIYVLDERAKTDLGRDYRTVQIRVRRETPARRFRVDESLAYVHGADITFVAKAPHFKLHAVAEIQSEPATEDVAAPALDA